MDYDILVKQAQELTRFMDKTIVKPKAVMLVVSEETGNWRLWIVPSTDTINKPEFYRLVAETITNNGITEIDVGSIQLTKSTNPAMIGMSGFIRMPGIGSAQFSNNTNNGVLLPDGIVIRMEL